MFLQFWLLQSLVQFLKKKGGARGFGGLLVSFFRLPPHGFSDNKKLLTMTKQLGIYDYADQVISRS